MLNARAMATSIMVFACAQAAAEKPKETLEVDPFAKVSVGSFHKDRGVWRYNVTSKYQKGENLVEVLLPDHYDAGRAYRVLYVLPVETGIGGRYGDGLMEVKKLGAHNRHQLVCVTMAFDQLPWYADHATDKQRQHESYITRVIVPFIESKYTTKGNAAGRLLLGFSKSGWGAFTLILRNPDLFARAASWDAPLMFTDWDKWPSRSWTAPFGSEETFRAFSPAALIEARAAAFKKDPARLILLGPGNFKQDAITMHEAMKRLGVQHTFDHTLDSRHDWHSGWVKPAIEYLTADASKATKENMP
ncbi:MAG: alpha/beta hydrolase-fold protein [Phycisphaeraceae bacterium]